MSPPQPEPPPLPEGFPRVSGDEPTFFLTFPLIFCFPRVSGDEPIMNAAWWYYVPFSPRERG